MKLEFGAGNRPTVGYTHNDLHPWSHIEHVGEPWMLDLPDNSCDEILALAFIEHLTYDHALDTFRTARRLLRRDGAFYFDVPDYPQWCRYYLAHMEGETRPKATLEHCRRTLFGWQRWPGDEHLYGWDPDLLADALGTCDLTVTSWSVEPFQSRTYRQRFYRPWDAHLYVTARPS